MSLRTQAERDLGATLEDSAAFGWPITLTRPAAPLVAEVSLSLTGYSADIAQAIDPDTGVPVSGRFASVALRMASILADPDVDELPRGAQGDARPWRVEFLDGPGVNYVWAVKQAHPDHTLGLVTCTLEASKGLV